MIRNSLAVALLLSLLSTATAAWSTLLDVSNPENVVEGFSATVSSGYVPIPALGNPAGLTDGLAPDPAEDAPFIFADNDFGGSISLSGFEGSIERVRVFVAPCDQARLPSIITLRSSTTPQSSLVGTEYETYLGDFIDNAFVYVEYSGSCRTYVDLVPPTASPAGTQSLWLSVASGGARLYEVQVFLAPDAQPVPLGWVAAFLAPLLLFVGLRAQYRATARTT